MRRSAATLAAIWLVAANLRAPLFALQPVLPDVRRDLGLSFSATGALSSVSLVVLGLASVPALYVGWRLGARRTVGVMAVAIAVASVARLAPPPALMMFLGSAALAAVVAFAQPAATVLLRRWFPRDLQRASGIWSNGVLVGGTVGSSAAPLLAAVAGWRGTFWVWSAVAVAVAAVWWLATPRAEVEVPRVALAEAFGNRRVWQVAALFTFQNLAYFAAATWLPFLLADRSAAYVAWVFMCLNLLPVVPLLVLPAIRWPYATSPVFYFGNGVMVVVGALGLAFGLRDLAWALAFLVGLGCAAAFVGAMALGPMVARSDAEAASITAVIFTFGYVLAFGGPLLGGALVDATHAVTIAFWPSIAAGVLMAVLGALVPRLLSVQPVEAAA